MVGAEAAGAAGPRPRQRGHRHRDQDPGDPGGRARATLPAPVDGGQGRGEESGLPALDERDERDGHGPRVDEQALVHADPRDHEHDGQDAEGQAGDDGPPSRVEPSSWGEPSKGVRVEDQAEHHDAGGLEHVVVIHSHSMQRRPPGGSRMSGGSEKRDDEYARTKGRP